MNPGKHSSSLAHAKSISFTYMNWEYILSINIKLALVHVNINVLIYMFFIDLMHLIELFIYINCINILLSQQSIVASRSRFVGQLFVPHVRPG